MKILFTIGGFGRGGKEGRMLSLMEYLAHHGHELGLVANLKSSRRSAALPFCRKTYDYRIGDAWFNLREHIRAVGEFQPDVIHSWNGSCTVCAILASLHRPCKVITSEITNAKPIRFFSGEFLMTRFNFAFSSRVLSNSGAGLKAKRAPGKGKVIYNGYRMSRLDEIEGRKYSRFNGSSALKVVMAARFCKEKDHGTVLRVAELARDAGLQMKFILAGEGSTLKSIRAEAAKRRLRNVAFAGYVSDIDNLLHHMDVGILATDPRFHQEGVSNSVLEYMAHGMPVIATEGEAATEVISDGVNGYITGERSPEELFERLRLLEGDRVLLKELGRNAYRTVEERFTLKTMGEQFLRLYYELDPSGSDEMVLASLQND